VLINALVTDAIQCSLHTRGGGLIVDHLGWRINIARSLSTVPPKI